MIGYAFRCFAIVSERLEGADHEGLVKMFRLKSSLSTQNYHLFNAEGKVQKYADELEIMKAFAAIRLAFYEVSHPHPFFPPKNHNHHIFDGWTSSHT